MLAEYSSTLSKLSIVLGSQSPRRQQILRDNLGIVEFRVIVSGFNEDIPKSSCASPVEYVEKTCRMKALDIIRSDSFSQSKPRHHLLITADTIVVHNNEILEKPRDRDDGFRMLRKLSGNVHEVVTGVTLATIKDDTSEINADNYDIQTFHEKTSVLFHDLPSSAINAYIDTGEPFDKAGGYVRSF